MKKFLCFALSLVFALTALLATLPLRAAAAGMSASFSGGGSIRAGDSVTVTFSVSGASGLYSVRGTLSYDSSLEFVSSSKLIGGGWNMDGTSTLLLEDASQASPFNGGNVFSVTFRVKKGVAPGTKVWAKISGISASDGSADYYAADASWGATVAAPLSGNAKLGSLTCGNAALSPAFSADTASYSVTVPYEVTSLSLKYTTQDSGAKVTVSGNSLGVGTNTVTVTVKAANGNTKTYSIRATRQQDPNYVPSSNALLSSLSLSAGKLSPAFDPEIMDYVVYLPYETESFSLDGVAQDGKAKSVSGSTAELAPGDNPMTVICTAEDGSTKVEYVVHVYRMPAYEGSLPNITDYDLADYTAVDAALAGVPADMDIYTEESAAALRRAVAAVVRDYPSEKQEEVDAMAADIEAALDALEEVPAPAPEPERTPWQKLMAVGGEPVALPLIVSLPLWSVVLAAVVLLLLLFCLIGMLLGRVTGERRALRRAQAEVSAESVVPPVSAPAKEASSAATAPSEPAEPEAAAEEESIPEEAAVSPPEHVPAAVEKAPPAEKPDGASPAMSLDELLDDIRNM